MSNYGTDQGVSPSLDMDEIPTNAEELIGYPQTFARVLTFCGRAALVRLDKDMLYNPRAKDSSTFSIDVPHDIYNNVKGGGVNKPMIGTVLIMEVWSDATKSMVRKTITAQPGQRPEVFDFMVRMAMNRHTDAQLCQLFMSQHFHHQVKFATNELDGIIQ